ncbi:tape measure protein [Stutzerimonas stutzeri]|uniref:tape measure protein n=1 Tax=Stutzerimonas stutzeri TaxID=316 RepID=UPI0005EACA9B|nr:tape measure protein [Stutzerimonas stutzeri]
MTDYARLVVSVDSTQVKKGDQALGDFEKSAKRTEKSVSSLGSVVRSVAAPLAAFLSVRAVIRASDEYGQMASRIRNATSSTEEYEMVQARLLETANGTYRALSEAQEVYLSTADTLRDLGYATSEVLDITDSFSYALVRDAARADQARTAMDAYSKALMKGKIDADGFASILAATPSIVNGIAEATGRSTEEIRKLGATGKLSVEALNEGLRRSRDENKALADAMETSVQDALVNLQTQFGVFVGKVNESSGASGALVDSIGELAEILADPETVEAAQQLAAGIVKSLGFIASAARETVSAVRWMSEELAVAFGGIGLQDLERLEAEASRLQELLNTMESRGETGYAIYGSTKQSYDKIKAQLDQAYELADLASTIGSDGKGSSEPPKALSESRKLVSAIAADTKAADAEAKKLTSSYQSMEKSLARQLALYGQTSEVASLRFEIEQGALKGIAGQQAEYLLGLARELDTKRDLTEQEKLRIDILRESGQLRAANDAQFQLEYAEKIAEYERQGNVEALQRLETLRRIREIQMNADQAPGTVEGVSQAPGTQGVDAVVGGAGGELIKLEKDAIALEQWRATELEKQRGFLEAKAITEEQYAERISNIHEQHQQRIAQIEQARYQVSLAGATDLFGNLADITSQFAGKQSGIYKAMFVAQKAFAIAQSVIAIQQGIALAAANPWPTNLGAMASVAAATAGLVSNISAVSLAGMAHDGIDNIPKEGTWLLDRGERVVDRRTNSDLKDYLADRKGGGGAPQITIHAPVTVEGQAGMSEQEMRKQGQVTADTINAVVTTKIERESRPGGLLWNLYGAGR